MGFDAGTVSMRARDDGARKLLLAAFCASRTFAPAILSVALGVLVVPHHHARPADN